MKEFSSFAEFGTFLGGMVAKEVAAEHAALERAAKLLETAAKEKIGHYQDEAGEFVAWAELADSTKADRTRQGFSENEPGLRTGEMRDSIGHRVEPGEAEVGSDDDKLVWFELGTSKQPPRSVLGATAVENAEKVVAIVGETVVMALCGEEVHEGAIKIPVPEAAE